MGIVMAVLPADMPSLNSLLLVANLKGPDTGSRDKQACGYACSPLLNCTSNSFIRYQMDSLAAELRLQIVREVWDTSDLKVLRCVNWSFCSLVDPILFAAIRVDTKTEDQLVKGFELLKSISIEGTRISRHVRKLIICCEDTMMARHFSYPNFCDLNEKEMRAAEVRKKERAQRAQKLLNESLSAAVRALKNLKAVKVVAGWQALSPASIWSTFQAEHIRLQEVESRGRIDGSILDYLNNFSGLVKLKIQSVHTSSDEETDSLATYFNSTILPRHRETLETLVVTGHEEGLWSFGEHNAQEYARCVNLRELEVCLNRADISAMTSGANTLSRCLRLGYQLSKLSSLRLCSSASKANRGARCGNPFMQHGRRMRELMDDGIRNFTVPSITRDLQLTADGRIYVLERDDSGLGRYSPSTMQPRLLFF
ncbi:hypothetical protein WG66_015167 [Moniliophthora roreri]|nr:hypothetical protein WG66_015167 [Moniliophthora roreri]